MILAKAGASVAGSIEICPNFHARRELAGQDLVICDLSQR
jgi:hypothetical protein